MITKKQSGVKNKSFPEQHLEIRLNSEATKHHEAIAALRAMTTSDRSKINTNRNLIGPPINMSSAEPRHKPSVFNSTQLLV
jgi:hypothetical protein